MYYLVLGRVKMLSYKWLLQDEKWQITNNKGLSYQLPNHNGMKYLTTLLKNQSTPVSYISLFYGDLQKRIDVEFQNAYHQILNQYWLHEVNWFSSIPKTDKKSIHEVYLEVVRKKVKIEEYTINNDLGMIELYEDEVEKLMSYLKAVCSRKKVIRIFDNDLDSLRNSVRKAIYRIFLIISEYDNNLVELLKAHIEYENFNMVLNRLDDAKIDVLMEPKRRACSRLYRSQSTNSLPFREKG